jgi:hypothetical protein
MLDSKVLEVLRISRCLNVTTCPTISQNLTRLHLEQTSNKEVPQSVNRKLKRLYLSGALINPVSHKTQLFGYEWLLKT